MNAPRLVVRNYDLFVSLGGARNGIVDADDLVGDARREQAQNWLESTLFDWSTACSKHLQDEDLPQILARMLYWPLLEIVLIVEILLSLKDTYTDSDRIKVYATEGTWLDTIARRLFLPKERNWEVCRSSGYDLRSRYERRRIALYPFQGPRTLRRSLRMLVLTLLSRVNAAMTRAFRLTNGVLILGEARFLPLIRFLRFSGIPASGDILKSFPFLAVPVRNTYFGEITRYVKRRLEKMDSLPVPGECWSYRGVDLAGLIRQIYQRDVIAKRSEWVAAVHYYERLIKEYTPRLIVFSTIDSERNALIGIIANSLGIPCMGMLDGYLAYNTSTSNNGFHNRPRIDWQGYCCQMHRESIAKAGVPQTNLISMPSPCIRSFAPVKHQSVRYKVVIFAYFVTLTTVKQYSGSHGRYLIECLDTVRALNARSVLIKCRYDEEIPHVSDLVAGRRDAFDAIDIEAGPSANYFRRGEYIIGGVSTTMMECAKSGGEYYVFEPTYGGMALSRDKETLEKNPVFAVTAGALKKNIQQRQFFGATAAQRRKFAIDIHLQGTEKRVWKESFAHILKARPGQ
jgi:hypothetical protein